jgi:tetratricopeptide (TPR) repeat protein
LRLAGPQDHRILAHASRFLAEITLMVRGDVALAAAIFERALEEARAQGSPHALARTLLMAAWVPYGRHELDQAHDLFREALELVRAADRDDAWAECRALVGLAAVASPRAPEGEALALAEEALAIAEAAGQAFSEAIAHQAIGASLRRLLRLDEAREHADRSVRTFRELGARWELAGALGDRGATARATGRLEEAVEDLREALALCRELSEQALVTWTGAELARTLAATGDVAAARTVLEDPVLHLAAGEPGSVTALLTAEAALAIAEGEAETARVKATAAISAEGPPDVVPNAHAAIVWWAGSLFGPDLVGGDETLREAREQLQRNGWEQALEEPGLGGAPGGSDPALQVSPPTSRG